MITAKRENHIITRNLSHFKKIYNRNQTAPPTNEKMEEEKPVKN